MKRKDSIVYDLLINEIEDLEQSYVSSHVIPMLEEYAKVLLKDLECEILLAVQKNAKGEIYVIDIEPESFKPELDDELDDETPIDIVSDCPQPDNELPKGIVLTRKNSKEAENRYLRITFPDGIVFTGKSANNTFIKTLKKIGLSRVAEVGLDCAGTNLVDTRERIGDKTKRQRFVDGKWVFINLSNRRKVNLLLKLDKQLNLGLKIEAIDNPDPEDPIHIETYEIKNFSPKSDK